MDNVVLNVNLSDLVEKRGFRMLSETGRSIFEIISWLRKLGQRKM